MDFVKAVRLSVTASQPIIWVRTHETTEVRHELKPAMQRARFYQWTVLDGLIDPDGNIFETKDPGGMGNVKGAEIGLVQAIQIFASEARKMKDDLNQIVLLISNFHHFADNPVVLQALQNFVDSDKVRSQSIILVAHYNAQVPADLRSYTTIVDHDLPDIETLASIAQSLLESATGPKELTSLFDRISTPLISRLAHAGLGLSRLQYAAEFAFSLADAANRGDAATEWSGVTEETLTNQLVECIQDRKAALFNAEGLVRLHRASETMSDIGGLDGFKNMVVKRFSRQKDRFKQDRYPRGVILLGPPGTGKSTVGKAIANELGLLLAIVDPGGLKQGIVGASEGRVRRLFAILNAMGRIVVFIDEIEKVFPTGNELDSGVSSDQLSVWLTNLAEPTRQYYVVASANNCNKLPAPLLRAGRFDNIVMVDIPKANQQKKIWEICRRKYGIPDEYETPSHKDWTGAEIDACCEASDGMGISLVQAARMIVPVAVMNPGAIEGVREYAHKRSLDSETGDIYYKPGAEPDPPIVAETGQRRSRRSINVDPGNN